MLIEPLTFPVVYDTNWHSVKLWFRPNVSIKTNFFARTFRVKSRYCKKLNDQIIHYKEAELLTLFYEQQENSGIPFFKTWL